MDKGRQWNRRFLSHTVEVRDGRPLDKITVDDVSKQGVWTPWKQLPDILSQ